MRKYAKYAEPRTIPRCSIGDVPGGECPNEATVRFVFRSRADGRAVESRPVCDDPACRTIAGYSACGCTTDVEPIAG